MWDHEVLTAAAALLREHAQNPAAETCDALARTLHVKWLKNGANCSGTAALMDRYDGCADIPDVPHHDDYARLDLDSTVVPDEVLVAEFERAWAETAAEIRRERAEGIIGPTSV